MKPIKSQNYTHTKNKNKNKNNSLEGIPMFTETKTFIKNKHTLNYNLFCKKMTLLLSLHEFADYILPLN